MTRKRSRDEFESDVRTEKKINLVNGASIPSEVIGLNDGNCSEPETRGQQDAAVSQLIRQPHTGPDNTNKEQAEVDQGNAENGGEWEVAKSSKRQEKLDKKLKKAEEEAEIKRKQAEEEAKLGPSLRFDPVRVRSSLRIKDLQSLVLYILADDVAPTWVGVRNAKQIDQVVVLMVPGMDKDMLEEATARMSHLSKSGDSANGSRAEGGPHVETKEHSSSRVSLTPGGIAEKLINRGTDLLENVIPVKAPGDSKTSRIYSPLQNMLISPDPEAKKNNNRGSADIFQALQTPLYNFIHTSDELIEAEFPVHSTLFTNPTDAQFEKLRRENAGQAISNGWVDSKVEASIPKFPDNASGAENPITLGLKVYALDCEMVLTDDDKYSLARISILDWNGKVILDSLVLPDLPIKNYFTQFSGITELKLKGVTTRLRDIQAKLLELFTPSTVLIGHSLESDLNALKMTHPFIVDTAIVYPHPRGLPLRSSLKFLTSKYLKREIQKGGADGHDSVEDARAVLDLIRLKCEKGPTWGTLDANGESIFSRLARAGHTTAIVEHGTPERGLGRHASIKIGCESDEEIVQGLIKVTSKEETDDGQSTRPAAFTWSRLRDMEIVRGWNSNSNRPVATSTTAPKITDHVDSADRQDTNPTHEKELAQASKDTINRLVRIYESLAKATLLIVFPGPGDMREVLRLHEMQRQYRKEFKVKKWDELSVQWTDTEEQALKKAFEKARYGNALVCLK